MAVILYVCSCLITFDRGVIADEAQEAEAIQVLNAIYDMREHSPNAKPEAMATIAHALAMLYFLLHDLERVSTQRPIFYPKFGVWVFGYVEVGCGF